MRRKGNKTGNSVDRGECEMKKKNLTFKIIAFYCFWEAFRLMTLQGPFSKGEIILLNIQFYSLVIGGIGILFVRIQSWARWLAIAGLVLISVYEMHYMVLPWGVLSLALAILLFRQK